MPGGYRQLFSKLPLDQLLRREPER